MFVFRREDAASAARVLRRTEAAIFVYFFDGDGDMELAGQDAAFGGYISLHHGSLSVLQEEHAAVAEFAQAQSVVQRLLREGMSVGSCESFPGGFRWIVIFVSDDM